MTCVAGVTHKGAVYLAGDSIAIGGLDMHVRDTPKVFRRGPFVLGCAGSFRLADVVRYHLGTVPRPAGDLHRYMAVDFVENLRDACKARGIASIENNVEEVAGGLLVGVAGRLFTIDEDFHVGEPSGGFAAIGCGFAVALGALHATPKVPPRTRLTTALTAAVRFSAGVRGPFHHVSLRPRR